MDVELDLCGAYYSGDDMLPTCDLPKGHDGDHHTEVAWPQWLPRPHDPDQEPSAMERVLHAAWEPMLAHQMGVRPVTGSTSVISVKGTDVLRLHGGPFDDQSWPLPEDFIYGEVVVYHGYFGHIQYGPSPDEQPHTEPMNPTVDTVHYHYLGEFTG